MSDQFSQDSRDSRDFPYCSTTPSTRAETSSEETESNNNKRNRLNGVNAVTREKADSWCARLPTGERDVALRALPNVWTAADGQGSLPVDRGGVLLPVQTVPVAAGAATGKVEGQTGTNDGGDAIAGTGTRRDAPGTMDHERTYS
jgi:hypothetical protein